MSLFLLYVHYCQNALIIGPILAAVCSLLSVFVVLRGMAMISEGVAHSGVGGLGLALLIGLMVSFTDNSISQLLITAGFCAATALVINYVSHGKHVSEDSAIGIFLVSAVSIGVVAIKARQYVGQVLFHRQIVTPVSLEDMLFGASITTANLQDLYLASIVCAIVFVVIFSMYKAFVYTALDEEMARINGVPVTLINTLLLLMVSIVIVIAVRMVGLFMINALMIIPGATARLISRSFGRVIIASLVVGVGGVSLSLLLALLFALRPPLDTIPTGPIMVLTLFCIFMVVWLFTRLFKPRVVQQRSDGA